MIDVTCVLDVGAELGECPVWCTREHVLYWVDIKGRTLNRFNPADATNERCRLGVEIGSFALREDGGIVAATREGFGFVDFDHKTIEAIADPEADFPGNRFNDGRCDPAGRFLAGTMADPFDPERPVGSLYRLERSLDCHKMLEGIGISNGLAFSPDAKTLYFADTQRQTIWAFDYDLETGTIRRQRIFATTHEFAGRPDGACVDEEGFYWSANVDGWQILRFAPDGRVQQRLAVPVQKPSMCAFGGANLDTLYITSIRVGSHTTLEPGQAHPGGLFACQPGVRGLSEPRFKG